jgi:hypothetical protein
MRIEGKCHCGNITYALDWPGDGTEIAVRACGCTFCTKHGGVWTSHRDAELVAVVRDESLLSKYRFGTETADFYVCSRCGVAPLVTSTIGDRVYAVVNVNTFEGINPSSLVRNAATSTVKIPAAVFSVANGTGSGTYGFRYQALISR